MSRILLFVYGTLKRGLSNHRRLEGQSLVGEATTKDAYQLWDLGPFPALTKEGPEPSRINGELYEIDQGCLDSCDLLEGHPNFYKRFKITVEVGGVACKAWCYFILQRHRVEHAKPITESWVRIPLPAYYHG